MRILLTVLSAVLGIYTGIQSYRIAAAGATQQIPQLQGDGGGGLVFAALCVIGAVLILKRPLFAAAALLFAALLVSFVALSFGDLVIFWWALAALCLSVCSYVVHRLSKSIRHRYGTPSPRNRSRVSGQ